METMKDYKTIYVGVVGYSKSDFNHEKAVESLKKAFTIIENQFPSAKFNCVSGLTNQGVPALAYKEACARLWSTTGVACGKVKNGNYELFPVDETIIVGEKWGDESEKFLSLLDVLVKIGGGKQSETEAAQAKEKGIKVLEYNIDNS
jgi:hypothetical protein